MVYRMFCWELYACHLVGCSCMDVSEVPSWEATAAPAFDTELGGGGVSCIRQAMTAELAWSIKQFAAFPCICLLGSSVCN